jgi:hypothetical protein
MRDHEFKVMCIYELSSYLTVNSYLLCYKEKSVDV